MAKYASYIKKIRKKGRLHFTSSEAMEELQVSRGAFDRGMHTLKANGDIISPAKGLYIIVPPEDQTIGSIPAADLMPILMSHWKADYYVCLLTAAMYHDASHQKPQVFQVMTNIQKPSLILGRIKIDFIYKKSLKDLPIVTRVAKTGYMKLSSPELTLADMFFYPHKAAGLSNIATVLSELIEALDKNKLIELIKKIDKNAWVQRLGFMLDTIDTMDRSKQAKILLAIKEYMCHRDLNYVPLSPEMPIAHKPRNETWKIIVNTTIESDYDS